MTGPHLTPEREYDAALVKRVANVLAWGVTTGPTHPDATFEKFAAQVLKVIDHEGWLASTAALDAERAAHAQTRTALTDSTALLIRGMGLGHGLTLDILDAQVQENQRILGLAVAEADKP